MWSLTREYVVCTTLELCEITEETTITYIQLEFSTTPTDTSVTESHGLFTYTMCGEIPAVTEFKSSKFFKCNFNL